jgi:hypothetical protein
LISKDRVRKKPVSGCFSTLVLQTPIGDIHFYNNDFTQTGGIFPPVVVFAPQIDELFQRQLVADMNGTLFKHSIETVVMKTDTKHELEIMKNESRDEFRPGPTIAVLTLLLAFIASSVYILITGYLNIA